MSLFLSLKMSMLEDFTYESNWREYVELESESMLHLDNIIVTEEAAFNDTLGSANRSKSILEFLLLTAPEFVKMVPSHWLEQILPPSYGQLSISIAFMIIGIPAHICHIIVFLTYIR